MHFVRSHTLGNDYLVMDPGKLPFTLGPDVVRFICDPHCGIGGRGILLVGSAEDADFSVRIFDADGAEAQRCDEGVLILAKFVRDHGYTTASRLTLQTPTGVVTCRLELEDGRVTNVNADVGKAVFEQSEQIELRGELLEVTSLSIGNPHCIVSVPDLSRVDIHRPDIPIEGLDAISDRATVQFAQVLSRREVRAESWKRGSGQAPTSGSSICAVAAACRRKNLVDQEMTVTTPQGAMSIYITEDGLMRMRGPAEEIYVGDLSSDLLRQIGGR